MLPGSENNVYKQCIFLYKVHLFNCLQYFSVSQKSTCLLVEYENERPYLKALRHFNEQRRKLQMSENFDNLTTPENPEHGSSDCSLHESSERKKN